MNKILFTLIILIPSIINGQVLQVCCDTTICSSSPVTLTADITGSINLGNLQNLIDNKKIKADEKININTLKKSKLFRKSINKFKVLSNGNFKSKIDIEADYSSKMAKEKIEKAGGQITVKNQSK